MFQYFYFKIYMYLVYLIKSFFNLDHLKNVMIFSVNENFPKHIILFVIFPRKHWFSLMNKSGRKISYLSSDLSLTWEGFLRCCDQAVAQTSVYYWRSSLNWDVLADILCFSRGKLHRKIDTTLSGVRGYSQMKRWMNHEKYRELWFPDMILSNDSILWRSLHVLHILTIA